MISWVMGMMSKKKKKLDRLFIGMYRDPREMGDGEEMKGKGRGWRRVIVLVRGVGRMQRRMCGGSKRGVDGGREDLLYQCIDFSN